MAVLRTYCIESSSHTATQMNQCVSALINIQVNTSQFSSDKCSAQTVASALSPCGVSMYPTRPTTIIGGVSRITVLGMVCLNGYRSTSSKEFMEYTLLLCILHKQRTVLFFDMAVLRTYCIKSSSRTATQVDQHISVLINLG
ncbi:hypothetical protein ALC57_14275 [Trachymyrmex cornetzi]|uniref:Uncharacterized protein n=1 Tax=Trachymyrmex cornetzi TaxID=471704 RepID=A0A195DL15_9HYME|nr:hypothetical protein ALC57_14275 [Trachymyrmex cornetzi]